MNKEAASVFLEQTFGSPVRKTEKVLEWRIGNIGLVLQMDQPTREAAAYIWLPYPEDGQSIPDFAFEYPAEAGRHSNTYAAPGLGRNSPALKLVVRTNKELAGAATYARALSAKQPLPVLRAEVFETDVPAPKFVGSDMPSVEEPKRRREAIQRSVQREVWQRDGGRCAECSTKEKLCFDHIVPFSKGGSNTVRNIQLLCERCNLSKGNRL